MADTGKVYIKVTDEIRSLVESEAIELCQERKVKNDDLNQAMAGVVCIRALKSLGCTIPKDKVLDALAVAMVCANASALKQKISSDKVAAAVDPAKIAELQSLVD